MLHKRQRDNNATTSSSWNKKCIAAREQVNLLKEQVRDLKLDLACAGKLKSASEATTSANLTTPELEARLLLRYKSTSRPKLFSLCMKQDFSKLETTTTTESYSKSSRRRRRRSSNSRSPESRPRARRRHYSYSRSPSPRRMQPRQHESGHSRHHAHDHRRIQYVYY